ncbi:MAG: glycoside hydrolase family 78 protein, partial [Candidatus Hodarchaeota archaeon]
MNKSLVINNLRCEYLINPLGIDVKTPRLSWIIESDKRDQYQTAYQILVSSNKDDLKNNKGDLWDTGKIDSDQTNHIIYDGIQLGSQMHCYWKVKVWDKNDTASDWSEIGTWSMGLLNPWDWKAKWIGAQKKEATKRKKYLPSPLLRKSFFIENKIKKALVYTTALGEYELYLNGNRVGDHFLAPEWTDYEVRVQYQTFDVSDLITEGENVIGAILGDGWFTGNMGPGLVHRFNCYGTDRRFIFQLIIEGAEGEIFEICSNSDWKLFEDGPIQKADHFHGEVYDTNKEQDGWNLTGFDDKNWSNVVLDDTINTKLVAQMNEPIRIVRQVKPIGISEPEKGVFIIDLGQNIQGFCKIHLKDSICEKDSKILIRHGEMLNSDGTLYTENLRNAKAREKITYDGRKSFEYRPHFTYHGFRYVEIKGLKEGSKPDKNIITGLVISSNCRIVGSFECSNQLLNKLYHNIIWTHIDNLISVPTDCPQRTERMGWMGDAQIFCQTSIYNMDMAAFYTKWIQDIRDSQKENGMYPHYVPFPAKDDDPDVLRLGSPAWSDCGVIIPWLMYLNYADKRIIEQHYESAKHYVDLIHSKNQGLVWNRMMGSNFNDWLNGDVIIAEGYPKFGAVIPKSVFATAYFAHSTYLLSKMAAILGNEVDSNKYSELSQNIKKVFAKRFINEDGKIRGNSQASYALSLHFDLVPENLISKVVNKLLDALKRYDNRISTGFCTTLPMMLELVRHEKVEIAYDLLLSKRFPSWSYMIEQGATTMWERWDGYVEGRGFQNPEMNSFNHYAYGAIGEWIYRVILGINIDEIKAGFKNIIINPIPGGDLTWAKGLHQSIHGKIKVNWSIDNGIFNLEVSIPANTTATVYLPAESAETAYENEIPIQESKEIKILSSENKTLS